MERIKAIFNLVRGVNLMFIALTQIGLQYLIMRPLFLLFNEGYNTNFVATLDHFHFAILCCSTLCIAAAGYIINDYFDVQADEINRPHKISINRFISRRKAMTLHLVLNGIGMAMALYLTYVLGSFRYLIFHLLTIVLLWYYSTYFKKKLLIGNIVISLLTAIVVLVVPFFEPLILNFYVHQKDIFSIYQEIFIGYAFFAFIITWIRELIKDMEDIKGDDFIGCRTAPIVLGIPWTKAITILLTGITILAVGKYQMAQFELDIFRSISLTFAFVQLPLIYVIYLVLIADKSTDYQIASKVVKLVMLAGICYLFYINSTFELV